MLTREGWKDLLLLLPLLLLAGACCACVLQRNDPAGGARFTGRCWSAVWRKERSEGAEEEEEVLFMAGG